jgi:hypothetical protein
MAVPVSSDIPPEQRFILNKTGRTVTRDMIRSQEKYLSMYRGLWKTVSIPLLITPRMNLIYYLADCY